jgi:arabinofuranan 3-O-arabinosyltransferase
MARPASGRRFSAPPWLSRHARQRLWPTGLLYAMLALAATLADTPRWYVADNRFEQYFDPSGVLGKMFSVWDPTRGFGAPRDDVWIATTLPTAMLRAVGLAPVATERLFHAMALVVLGVGVAALLRQFRRPYGAEHVVAGLLAMFNPYTLSFLVPSNLFAMVAISPWLAVVFVKGVREDRPWRHAAGFALLVFVAGNSDTPGLLYAGVMLVVVAIYLVGVERTTTARTVAAWSVKAASLALLCSAWMLTKTYFAAEELNARLADTEAPRTSFIASSWSESIRGLGNWLSYFREDGRLLKPQTVPYFDRPLVALATFALPTLALLVVWRSRWPGRLVFAMMMVAGLVIMVGGFAGPDSSPLGRSILWLFENHRGAASLRNTYKAGAGLVVGTSVLAAVGTVALYRRARQHSRRAGIGVGLAGGLIAAVAAFPFVTGQMYHPFERVEAVPDHWLEAVAHLEALPPGGRTLIVPAVSQTEYRWGYVGDDIFDALLDRPHATATGWMLSKQSAHNALEAITLAAQDPHHRPGVIAPMARRLGITEIVIRNDVDWNRASIARPAAFAGLRADPDLELVATFGERGSTNVVSPLDTSSDTSYERTLPPVEIYRVTSSRGLLDATPDRATLVVSGDAHGWPQLATAGLLDDEPSLAPSAELSDEEVVHELDNGAMVAVTDTAQRRVRTMLRHEPQLSPVLAEGQELDRPVRPLFEAAGSESVAWYRDAETITGAFVRFGGNRNDLRAANAFDDDLTTSWAVPFSGVGEARPTLEVRLRKPEMVGYIEIVSSRSATGRPTVREIEVVFSDGTTTEVDLGTDGRGVLDIAPRRTSLIRISLTQLASFGAEAGLSDVKVAGLDLLEHIATPTDLVERSAPEVRAALRSAPVAYTFRRVARPISSVRAGRESSRYDEEITLRRRFDVVHDDRFTVSGTLRLLDSSSDEATAALLAAPVSASSNRAGGALATGAANVLDGDLRTVWSGGAVIGTGLSVSIDSQPVRSVVVRVPVDPSTAEIRRVVIDAGGRRVASATGSLTCTARPDRVCSRAAVAIFPDDTVADSVTVRASTIGTGSAVDTSRVRIADVSVFGLDGPVRLDLEAPISTRCFDLGLSIGSDATSLGSVRVRSSGTVGQVLMGEPVPFEACTPVALREGVHLLRTSPGSPIDEVRLLPTARSSASTAGAPAQVAWRQESPDRIRGVIEHDGTTRLTMRTSFDPRWVLEIHGERHRPQHRDAMNSWIITTAGTSRFAIVYEPAVPLGRAVIVSVLSVLVCAGLVLWPRRRQPADATVTAITSTSAPLSNRSVKDRRRWIDDLVPVAVATAVGLGLMGAPALAVGAVTLVSVRYVPGGSDALGLVAPALVSLAGLWSVLAYLSAPVSVAYATQRWAPSILVQIAVVFLVQWLFLAGRDTRAEDRTP